MKYGSLCKPYKCLQGSPVDGTLIAAAWSFGSVCESVQSGDRRVPTEQLTIVRLVSTNYRMSGTVREIMATGIYWFALQVKPRYERLTSTVLEGKGFESFL